jgi:hypothetical protein
VGGGQDGHDQLAGTFCLGHDLSFSGMAQSPESQNVEFIQEEAIFPLGFFFFF